MIRIPIVIRNDIKTRCDIITFRHLLTRHHVVLVDVSNGRSLYSRQK